MLSDNPIGVHFVVAIKICRIEKINTTSSGPRVASVAAVEAGRQRIQ